MRLAGSLHANFMALEGAITWSIELVIFFNDLF